MLAIIELLLSLVLKDFAAPVTTQVVEDAVTGKLTAPPKQLVDAVGSDAVDDQVRLSLAEFEESNK